MANIRIKTINYITAGKKQKYVNLDIGYRPEDYDYHVLAEEGFTQTLIGENGTGLKIFNELSNYYIDLYLSSEYIRNSVYALGMEKHPDLHPNTKDNEDNLFSLFDLTNDVIIHNLFDIKDVCIKSNIVDSNDHHIDLYAPTIDRNLLGLALLEDFTYGLTDKSTHGFNLINTNLSALKESLTESLVHDLSYKYYIHTESPKTYLYDVNANEENAFSIKRNLSSLQYNYLLELQNQDSFNEYEDGDVFGDVLIGKNAFDSMYSMQMSAYNRINNCRLYCGLGVCGNELFMTYRDDINYIGEDTNEMDVNLSARTYDDGDLNQYTFLKVERIGGINRFSSLSYHRSNMYSIKIENTGLEQLDVNEEFKLLKNQILFDITSNIKDLAKNLCPVNTQLLKVEID